MRRPLPDFEKEFEFKEKLRQPSPVVGLLQKLEHVGSELDDSFDTEDAENLACNLVLGDDTPIVPTPVLRPVPILEVESSSKPESSESHRTARIDRIRGSFRGH